MGQVTAMDSLRRHASHGKPGLLACLSPAEAAEVVGEVDRLTAELERWKAGEDTFFGLARDYVHANPGTDAVEQAWFAMKGAVEHWEAVERRRATEPATVAAPDRPELPWSVQTVEGYTRLRVNVWPSHEHPRTGSVNVSDAWAELSADELEQGAAAMVEAARRIRVAEQGGMQDPPPARPSAWDVLVEPVPAADKRVLAAAEAWRQRIIGDREYRAMVLDPIARDLVDAVDARRALVHTAPDANQLTNELRVVNLIGEWLNKKFDLALAGFGEASDIEHGARKGITQMRHLHLEDYPYTLVPAILATLTHPAPVSGWKADHQPDVPEKWRDYTIEGSVAADGCHGWLERHRCLFCAWAGGGRVRTAYDKDIIDALHWCCLGSVYPADPNAFERARTAGLLDAHPWTTTAAGELELAQQRPEAYGKRPMAVACPRCKAGPLQLCIGRVPSGEIVHVSRWRAGHQPAAVSSVPGQEAGA